MKIVAWTISHSFSAKLLLFTIQFEEIPDEAVKEPIPDLQLEPEIPLHALTRWSTPKTMRVITKSEKVANLLHLPVVPTKPFSVQPANGNQL